MPNVEVTATGNVTSAVTALEKLDKALVETVVSADKTQKSLSSLSAAVTRIPAPFANSAKGVEAFNKTLNNVTPGVDKLATSLSTGLRSGSAQASQALINVGRVAQDSAFGFIGIANNLNPLLESFQRLRAESGSNALALKALGSSLLGAGGIGLALSALTAILQFSQLGFSAWTRGFGESKSKIDEVKKATDAFTETVKNLSQFQKDVSESSGKEIANLQILKGVIENVAKPMDVRLQAVKDIQKEFPQYFAGLTNEAILAGRVGDAYIRASNAIIQKSKAAAATTQVEKLYGEINQLEIERLNQNKSFNDKLIEIDAKTKKFISTATSSTAKSDISNAKVLQAALERIETEKYNKSKQLLDQQLADRKKQAQQFIDIAIDNTVFDPDKVQKVKKVKVEVEKVELIPQLGNGLFESYFKDLSRSSGSTIALDVVPKINPIVIDPAEQDKILAAFRAFLNAEALQKFSDEINAMISSTLTNIGISAINTAAEAIGAAIGGNQNALPNLFGALISDLGGQLKNLGAAMVQAGVEMLVIKKAIDALKFNPYLAIIAGFALQVVGSALQTSLSKQPKGFASGGTVGEGGVYRVGERGEERIFLPGGTRVQPNNEVNAYGGGGQSERLVASISGADLVILLQRGQAQMGRNN